MTETSCDRIRFVRLPAVAPDDIMAHMSDPRVAAHMPLLDAPWSAQTQAAFIAAKEACWARDGLGHWAILYDDSYVGWGGFQKEGPDWDFGLVLRPESFGLGLRIARKALALARSDPRIPYVTFLLPPSRKHLGALRRIGARPLGEVIHDGTRFRKFRLDTGAPPG